MALHINELIGLYYIWMVNLQLDGKLKNASNETEHVRRDIQLVNYFTYVHKYIFKFIYFI